MHDLIHNLSGVRLAAAACALAAMAVFAVMLYSIATFRRSADSRRRSAVEVLWAIVPILIVIATALPALRTLAPADPPLETIVHPRPAPGPALAGEIPQKAFP